MSRNVPAKKVGGNPWEAVHGHAVPLVMAGRQGMCAGGLSVTRAGLAELSA